MLQGQKVSPLFEKAGCSPVDFSQTRVFLLQKASHLHALCACGYLSSIVTVVLNTIINILYFWGLIYQCDHRRCPCWGVLSLPPLRLRGLQPTHTAGLNHISENKARFLSSHSRKLLEVLGKHTKLTTGFTFSLNCLKCS